MKSAVWNCSGVSSALAALGTSVGGASVAYPFWFPDVESYPPFQIGVTATSCSTSATAPAYNIEFTNDFLFYSQYALQQSSNANVLGISSTSANAPVWFTLQSVTQGTTGLTGAASNISGIILQPVTALRLNVTAGSTLQFINVKLVQTG